MRVLVSCALVASFACSATDPEAADGGTDADAGVVPDAGPVDAGTVACASASGCATFDGALQGQTFTPAYVGAAKLELFPAARVVLVSSGPGTCEAAAMRANPPDTSVLMFAFTTPAVATFRVGSLGTTTVAATYSAWDAECGSQLEGGRSEIVATSGFVELTAVDTTTDRLEGRYEVSFDTELVKGTFTTVTCASTMPFGQHVACSP